MKIDLRGFSASEWESDETSEAGDPSGAASRVISVSANAGGDEHLHCGGAKGANPDRQSIFWPTCVDAYVEL